MLNVLPVLPNFLQSNPLVIITKSFLSDVKVETFLMKENQYCKLLYFINYQNQFRLLKNGTC